MTNSSAVDRDLPCDGCGYNLRGLDRAGRCPECAASIVDSETAARRRGLPLQLLRVRGAPWLASALRTLNAALLAWICCVIAGITVEVFGSIPLVWHNPIAATIWMIAPVSAYVVSCLAAWRSATLYAHPAARSAVRMLALCSVAWVGIWFINHRWLDFYFGSTRRWEVSWRLWPLCDELGALLAIALPILNVILSLRLAHGLLLTRWRMRIPLSLLLALAGVAGAASMGFLVILIFQGRYRMPISSGDLLPALVGPASTTPFAVSAGVGGVSRWWQGWYPSWRYIAGPLGIAALEFVVGIALFYVRLALKRAVRLGAIT